MTQPRWFIAPLAAALVFLAVACGGDKKDNDSANADTPGGGGAATSQALDLSSAAESLLDVKSFRFNLSLKLNVDDPTGGSGSDDNAFGAAMLALLGNINVNGAYVSPDRYEVQTKLFGQDVHAIQIGDQAWVNDGSGWTETESADDLGMFGLSGSPTDLLNEFLPEEVLSGAKTKQEKVNGVDTTRYSFDKKSLSDLAEKLGEDTGQFDEVDDLNLDVWVTKDNLPVKIALKGSGESEGTKMSVEVNFNITDLNDSGIKIEKPI
ncbi:MAG TPA: hypothetical protein VFX19_10055 [Dehalococcoidia bacterium]|jgi:hypothetical protein|nr:hypothetical protein [Dehalococcoidia bacterium]